MTHDLRRAITAAISLGLLVIGVLLGVLLAGDVTRGLIGAALVTVVILAVSILPVSVMTRLAGPVVLVAGSAAWPAVTLFLPAVAVPSVLAGMDLWRVRSRRTAGVLAMALPTVAALIGAVVATGPLPDITLDNTDGLVGWLVVMLTVAATGMTAVLAGLMARCDDYRAIVDIRREQLRRMHHQVAVVEEDRAQQVRHAQLQERTRIARDIHDSVGHLLTRAIMQAQAARVVMDAGDADAVHVGLVEQMGVTLDEAMTMVRRSVHDLNERGTDFADQIAEAAAGSPDDHFDIVLANGIHDAPPASVCHVLATTIRESLTNVRKHGPAVTRVTVTLRDLPTLWQLVVQDNGAVVPAGGPAVVACHDGAFDGIGIIGIEERVRMLDGSATCGPNGAGWRVFVGIPKPPET
ncbi:sensor histidine kinase [Bifidobacterium choloepi]|uniref:histidine kinase n=1 Tax=Bifidobacterium choloepi TaxID=2614131 RepID=A0A6I5NFJ5_9BIFI|nr:histidine kinase [Bifidobacterium choloepi]NEG70114.1 two-component sensor histidine kinase [Bifidobacterium choloepi]